jgi:hypothetical protein
MKDQRNVSINLSGSCFFNDTYQPHGLYNIEWSEVVVAYYDIYFEGLKK